MKKALLSLSVAALLVACGGGVKPVSTAVLQPSATPAAVATALPTRILIDYMGEVSSYPVQAYIAALDTWSHERTGYWIAMCELLEAHPGWDENQVRNQILFEMGNQRIQDTMTPLYIETRSQFLALGTPVAKSGELAPDYELWRDLNLSQCHKGTATPEPEPLG